MKISLRKASVLQNSINDVVKTVAIADTISINEFQDAETLIAAKALESVLSYQRKLGLINALYSIRSAVADANATNGVSKRLTEIAHLDKVMALNLQLAGFTVRTEPAIVAGKLDKIRNRKEDIRTSIYGHADEVSTGVFNDATVADFKSKTQTLKKEKQRLQDEILELNVRTEIALTESVVKTLQAEGLL